MDAIAVFVALTSPLLRARLRTTLLAAPGVDFVGEAGDAASVVAATLARPPDVLLVDERLLADLLNTGLQRQLPALHLVLAGTATELAPVSHGLRLSGTLPLTIQPPEMVERLRRLLAPEASPPAPRVPPEPEVQQRLRFSGALGPREPARPQSPPHAPADSAPASGSRRRTRSARLDALVAALRAVQAAERDALTGLAGPAALGQTWALLPQAQQAATFIAVELQDQSCAPAQDVAILRRLGATLRANVRREDLVCRAGPATFVLLLPGLGSQEAAEPVRRLRLALAAVCGSRLSTAGRVVIGVSHWEAGQIPAAILAQCLTALRNVAVQPGHGPARAETLTAAVGWAQYTSS